MYQTGDILISSAANLPFLRHVGVIVVEDCVPYILHNTPMKINSCGGNLVYEPLAAFLADGRQILEVWGSDLTLEVIICWAEKLKHKLFDTLNWNCEQFVNFLLTCKRTSPQAVAIATLCGLGLLILL